LTSLLSDKKSNQYQYSYQEDDVNGRYIEGKQHLIHGHFSIMLHQAFRFNEFVIKNSTTNLENTYSASINGAE